MRLIRVGCGVVARAAPVLLLLSLAFLTAFDAARSGEPSPPDAVAGPHNAQPAADRPLSDASAPWTLRSVARRAAAGADAADPGDKPPAETPFLHLRVAFRDPKAEPKFHEFRITDRHGKTVAEPYGFHQEKSLVVFEGEWADLRGLYLDGHKLRVPLLAEAAKAPIAATPPQPGPTIVAPTQPPAVAEPTNPTPSPGRAAVVRPGAMPPAPRSADETPASGVPRPMIVDAPGQTPAVPPPAKVVCPTRPAAATGEGRGSSGGGRGNGGGAGGGSSGGNSRGAAGVRQPGISSIAGSAGLGGDLPPRLRPRGVGPMPVPATPSMVLYLACSTDLGKGRVYQVDEGGRVLGIVDLPYPPTGIALHRQSAVVTVSPRDGGHLWRIDDTGRVETILRRQAALTDPVDVGIPADSDTVVVADSQSHSLWATSTAGGSPRLYQKMAGLAILDRPAMSVAVTVDKNVLYGTDNAAGVYRFTGQSSAAEKPLLPGRGAVAADTVSLQWAATQSNNRILVYDGESLVKTIQLPGGKAFLGGGMLSFAPASTVVTAVRPIDDPAGAVWFLQFGTKNNVANALFRWEKAPVLDFVVGPRMPWNGNWPGGKTTPPPFPR